MPLATLEEHAPASDVPHEATDGRSRNPLVAWIRAARRVSVPLVGVTTSDAAATILTIGDALPEGTPQVVWDTASGLRARNTAGREALTGLVRDGMDMTVGNPQEMARVVARLPSPGIVYVHMASRWLGNPGVLQAIWNLRDLFKQDHRTMVLLGPTLDLPPELVHDVMVFDEPLPDDRALEAIVRDLVRSAELPAMSSVDAPVDAIRGLPAFVAEQAVAMSLSTDGIDLPALWELKRRMVEQTPGLRVYRGTERFDDIGGVPAAKEYLARILRGRASPGAIVFLDEVEKMLAGATGADTTGIAQDQLGAILSYMEDQQAVGCIFVGPPGTAKSLVAKAAGNEARVPTIQLDLGGAKGPLVGQSEAALRQALKVITRVSSGRSLWIATSNNIASLPPELRRRFTLGVFFFDLPTPAERESIWQVTLARYRALGLPPEASQARPADDGWTGAEIRLCCDNAWRLDCTLTEAARYVVPVSRSAAEQVEQLRRCAEGKFLSANVPGVYHRPSGHGEALPPVRRVSPLN